MTCRRAALLFIAVALAFCVPSRADEDGSFCTFRGYLAYELRNGITPSEAGHVLKVVRFEPMRGIFTAGEVTLQDFQVHRMTCGQDHVEISGWGNIFKKYTIDIAGQDKLSIVEYTEDPNRRFDSSKDGPGAPKFAYAQTRLTFRACGGFRQTVKSRWAAKTKGRVLPEHHYSRNPSDSNACYGTSIGANFNCSHAPICASNLR
jgi:hypothetical protein